MKAMMPALQGHGGDQRELVETMEDIRRPLGAGVAAAEVEVAVSLAG